MHKTARLSIFLPPKMLHTRIFLILFLNKHIDMLLDADDGSEMMLAELLSKSGEGILAKEWYYSTELRVLNTQLLRAPLFHFSNNWHTIRIIGNCLMYIIMMLSLYLFCRENSIAVYYPILCSILLIPFSNDHFWFVLKGIYYTPYIVISFVMIALTIIFGKAESKGIKKVAILVVAMILSFFSGLGGARQLFVYYIPMALAVLCLCWTKHRVGDQERQYLIFTFATCFVAVVGYYINHHFLKQNYPYEDRELIHYTRIWAETVFKVVNGWLVGFGYRQGESIFSFATIKNILSVSIFLLAGYSIYLIFRNREKYSAGIILTVFFFSLGMFFSLAFYSCTDSPYETRYCYPIAIFVLPIIFMGIGKCTDIHWIGKKGITIGLLIVLMFICGADNYREIAETAENSENIERSKISEYLVKNGYTDGYASFWNGNVFTELSNGQIEVWVLGTAYGLDDKDDLNSVFSWLQYKSHSTSHPEGKIFVILTVDESERVTFFKALPIDNVIYRSNNYLVYGFETYEELYEKCTSAGV